MLREIGATMQFLVPVSDGTAGESVLSHDDVRR